MQFKWMAGRQVEGYQKMLLVSLFRFDVYLIKYPPNFELPVHVDPAPEGFEHHRMNITLRGGGIFFVQFQNGAVNLGGTVAHHKGGTSFRMKSKDRYAIFRPDIMPHSFTNFDKETIKLSIGWLRRKQ